MEMDEWKLKVAVVSLKQQQPEPASKHQPASSSNRFKVRSLFGFSRRSDVLQDLRTRQNTAKDASMHDLAA